MARLRFNRLLSQFLEGIISLFVMRPAGRITFRQLRPSCAAARDFAAACPAIALPMPALCRLVVAGCRLGLRFLRSRAFCRLGVVGEDLGVSQHRDLVAIAALAPRILATALLELN